MTRILLAFAALALLVSARPAPRAPARDWLETVTVTPAGSYVRGNPAAKVKLVEYASFTCSHCAAFSGEAKAGLGGLIRAGAVNLEVRNAIRDRYDLAAALLARCRGPKRYFAASDAIFAAQARWLDKAATLAEPAPTASMADALSAAARGVGLDAIAAPGLPPAGVARCLGDTAELGRLTRMREEAWAQRRIPGTPFFLIDGRPVADTATWDKLEPALRAAM